MVGADIRWLAPTLDGWRRHPRSNANAPRAPLGPRIQSSTGSADGVASCLLDGSIMQRAPSRAILLVVLATIASCTGELPPPPGLSVTSPERGLTQSDAGQVVVKGTVQPSPSGSPVTGVMVNDVPAQLAADGSFTAVVAVPAGAMLLETVAVSEEGGK